MSPENADFPMRMAAFEHVRRLSELHDHLTAKELRPGFIFEGKRIPLMNPQRGIFKPRQMRYLLSIKTVVPRPGARVWYDDQLEVHRQIYEGDEAVEYAFMGQDPEAADNLWLRKALENQIPVIYFLGVAPGCYQAVIPTYIGGWDGTALKARIIFGIPDQNELAAPKMPWSAVMRFASYSSGSIRARSARLLSPPTMVAAPYPGCLNNGCWMLHTLFPTRTNSWGSLLFRTGWHFQRSITRRSIDT